MVNSVSNRSKTYFAGRSIGSIAAVFIVFMMVTASFAAFLARGYYSPEVWTDKDEYCQGETVYIYGDGFASWVDVDIELSHPDIGTILYTETPDVNGEFVCDDYVAEWVTGNESVKVVVTQVLFDETLVAETEFWDPAAYIEGYTIRPHSKFTKGDIKGYYEGDSVPYMVGLDRAQLGGVDEVTVWLSFDYCDHNSPTQPVYGIDYLTEYWDPDVNPPYNTYPASSAPFKADDGHGVVTDQVELPHEFAEGGVQELMIWRFTFEFAEGVSHALVRFGAHLAVTAVAAGYDPPGLGAAFYPGAALHVNLYDLDPSANEGDLDVPISAPGILIPPHMTLEKCCDPNMVGMGDEITFTLTWSNDGWADAACVVLSDDLPYVVDLDETSFLHWTSVNPTKMPVAGIVVIGGHFEWDIGMWPGTGPDGSDPPLIGYLEFKATVNTNEQGCYENWATLTYGDDHGGYYPPVEASCEFCIVGEPEIEIEKCGPLYAHVGDVVTYEYTITNIGPVDLENVDAEDDVAGLVVEDDTLAVGEDKDYTLTYEIGGSDPDPLVNCVEVTAEDSYERTATDDACWEIDILHPDIVVEKSSDKSCGEIGEDIEYTITVKNPVWTDADLYDVNVTDPLIGLVWVVGTLLQGQSETMIVTTTIAPGHNDPIRNNATAVGKDLLGFEVSNISSDVVVDIYHPMIEVEKGANKSCAEIGEMVTYWINVSNPSWDTLMHAHVVDELVDLNAWMDLAPGEWWNESFEYVVLRDDPDPLRNVVTVDAIDDQEHCVSASAQYDVDIFHPAILVTKEANKTCAAAGEEIGYWINVTNPSDDTRMYAIVNDSMFGGVIWEGWIEPEETEPLVESYTVKEGEDDPLLNTVHVLAQDEQGHEREEWAEWEIDIYHPEIEVRKGVNKPCAGVGDWLIYWINVSNPSDDTPMKAKVNDPMLGGVVYDEWLPPGCFVNLSFKYQVLEPYPDPLINEVLVEAWDQQEHYANASASCSVDILHPDVLITKEASEVCAAVREDVTYWINVTNPAWADVWLNGTVTDDKLGQSWTFTNLKPGETKNYTYVMTMPDEDPFENTAEVEAFDHQEHRVYKEASWTVDIVHPDVIITKEANETCAKAGEWVLYWINVTNPAWTDVWLNGTVTDDKLGQSWIFTNLKPGDTEYYTYAMIMPDEDPFENTAEVEAFDHQEHMVCREASWTIDIVHPEVIITKEASEVCAAVGEYVIYWINVTNPARADVWLNGTITDETLGITWPFRELKPGQTIPIEIEVLMPDEDPFINEASVCAMDHQEHIVEGWASWTVDVVHPQVLITKESNLTCAAVGEWVLFWINVTNPASADVWLNGTVTDDKLGQSWTFTNLKPGDTEYYTYSMIMPDEDPFENTAEVEAFDHQEHRVTARAVCVVDIVHPMIDITKYSRLTCAHVGETILYIITVSVPEEADVCMSGVVYDDDLGWVESFFDLCPGASISWTVEYLVTEETPDPFTNTANVTAEDHQGHVVEDSDSWTVDILFPAVEITKVGPEYAEIGELITYYVTVTNTGDTPLYNVTVEDSLAGTIASYAMLDVDQVEHISYDFTVPAGEGMLDNLVKVEGEDKQHEVVNDTAEWSVFKYGQISGFKTADLNGDGDWDVGEPGIVNWVIQLYGELVGGGTDIRTRMTDTDGSYEFTSLMAGTYTISEVMQTGWKNYTTMSYTVTVGSGTVLTGLSFGNMPYGSICGYKWLDSNENGIWDEGEDPIPEWTIYIVGEDIAGIGVAGSTVTDEYGFYCFSDLMPGVYTVYEMLEDGWINTTSSSILIDVGYLVPFEETDVNFGNVKYGKITGYKWLDEWMNGIWDGQEQALPGWEIELTGTLADGSPFGPIYTITDENGFFCFCDLLPGTYVVREIIPDGWTHITPDRFEVTIDMDDVAFCAKFGNVPYSTIDGWKFLDWDMDGFFDGVEDGIEGWAITLEGWLNDGIPPYSLDGTYVGPFTVYTDAQGYWCFVDLLPGVYKVTEEVRDLWYNTTPIEYWIMICPYSNPFDVKFGNVPYTCFSGYKFKDINGDGERTQDEPGLPGWIIMIVGYQNDDVPVTWELETDEQGCWTTCYNILPGSYRVYEIMQKGWVNTTPAECEFVIPMCPEPMEYVFPFGNFELGRICGYKYEDMNGNGILDGGDVPIQGWEIYLSGAAVAMTTTDIYGYYCFEGLMYGDYTVTEEDRVGWKNMTVMSHTVTIISGADECLPEFLNVEYCMIWGYKFEDDNSNGEWDPGEDPIEGWNITMVWGTDPTEYFVKTDEFGYYEFTGLLPSDYYKVMEETPAGWTWTTTPYEEFDLESGENYQVHDFGNFKNVEIRVFKYEDVDGDGIYDEGYDRPLEGWEIIVSGPGLPGGMITLSTGSDGWASVEVTQAGMYEATEILLEGWTATTPQTAMVSVESNVSDPECVRFGNFHDVTIVLFKYEDKDSNGTYDNDDEPIPDWEFYLESEGPSGSFTVFTGIDGSISVTFNTADYWTITEVLPEGWVSINPASGIVTIWVESGYVYYLEGEMECYYYEFGNFECVDILVFKYWDKCSNGWYDPTFGDEMLEGWCFELRDVTGAMLDYGYTDENGTLQFTVCRAGFYYVVEEERGGWTHIEPASGYYEVEVMSGEGPIELWFANYLDVDIPIFKYEDVNSNGTYDEGIDIPIPEWYFKLSTEGGDIVCSGYTDGNGKLVLTVNRSGTYILTEEDREGWTPINPAGGSVVLSIVSGKEVEEQRFGNFEDVIIIIHKFDDRHADGEYCPDDNDSMLEGWVFELYLWVDDEWVYLGNGTTDSEGELEFVLTQAGKYKVVEILQGGWFIVMPVEPEPGEYIVDVVSGDDPIHCWFANFKLGKIYGWKWNDLNGDGEWDTGEEGLSGWTIRFEGYFWVGEVMYYLYGDTLTNESGYYEFTGLPPGMYLVSEDVIGGWVNTTETEVEVEIIGHTEARVDFFNFEKGCIWGYKYEDMNGDGILDGGDMPLKDWNISLYLGDSLEATTTTDGDGYYMFCDLGPGVYTVLEESRLGWKNMTVKEHDVPMISGESIRVDDFLNFELGSIWGWKFEDLDSDGKWDPGEPAIEGWNITLVKEGDPTEIVVQTNKSGYFEFTDLEAGSYNVSEESVVGWTHTTNWTYTKGIFSGSHFELCPFGNFKNVSIEVFKYEDVDGNGVYNGGDNPIEGWNFTVTGPCFPTPLVVSTDENGEIVIWITEAGIYVVTEEDKDGWDHVNPESGTESFEVESGDVFEPFEFGNFMLGEITGLKYYDWNLDGFKNESEAGLANWIIWINGTLVSGGYLNFTRVTNSVGFYQVLGLPAGIYVVSERLEFAPAGWVPTLPTSVTVDITSGKVTTVNFANAVFGIVEGYKFYDKDLDGEWDIDEPGLGGWTITLTGVTNEGIPVDRSVVTDSTGYYLFDEVQPGIYNVSEELWVNWASTTALPVLLEFSGAMEYFEATVHIGNVRYAKVFGYKFEDTIPDCYPYWPNGIFDEHEHGLSAWTITLEGWTTTGMYVSMVCYTDEYGYYEFIELLPGTYWVNETLLDGWYASTPIANMIEIYPYPQGTVIFRIDFGNVVPEPDPEVPFYLNQGWNLWSMPIVVDGLTASSLLDAIGLNGLAVTTFDIEQRKYKSYVAGMSLERDFPVVSGLGYFIYVTADTAFTLKGTFESQPRTDLVSGWNFIGYSSLKPVMASELLEMVEGSYGLALTYYNEDEGKYESYVAGFSSERDFLVSPGNAYYIWVGGPCEIVFG